MYERFSIRGAQDFLGETERDLYASFTMAFQPVWDSETETIYGHEALVRAPGGDNAAAVFSRIRPPARYDFDRLCRLKALERAVEMSVPGLLFLNFLANSVLTRGNAIEATVDAARALGFPPDRIILEFTEKEDVEDMPYLRRNVAANKPSGFRTAMDDFGAGYSGLQLLCRVTPDFIKVDRELIKNIDTDKRRYRIMQSMMDLLLDLGHIVIIEGVETYGEYSALQDLGATRFQGYFLAPPRIDRLTTAEDILNRLRPGTAA